MTRAKKTAPKARKAGAKEPAGTLVLNYVIPRRTKLGAFLQRIGLVKQLVISITIDTKTETITTVKFV